MKRITGICFNWYYSPTDNSEHYASYYIGQNGVDLIEYCPDYPGAPGRYIVGFENGKEEWLFNVCQVFREPIPASETPSSHHTFDLPF